MCSSDLTVDVSVPEKLDKDEQHAVEELAKVLRSPRGESASRDDKAGN